MKMWTSLQEAAFVGPAGGGGDAVVGAGAGAATVEAGVI